MCPPVFDDGPRDIAGGADHLVPQFEYLNRSDRDEAERVRDLIEDMFSRYPVEAQDMLRTRLRSVDDYQHMGAVFELVLHELLLRSGCQVLSIEPSLDGTDRSPDFLAQTEAGARFYLEASLATGRSRAQEGADRRLREALQAIDSVRSPDFFLDVHIAGTPAAPVSGRRLRRRLEGWLETLNYEQIIAQANHEATANPACTYEEHGVRFRIAVIPRDQTRGITERRRAIAGRTLAPLSVQPQEPIRTAVLGKAGRYRDLDAPYIVAVNALSTYAREGDAIDALFGTEIVSVRQTAEGFEDRTGRDTDGVWYGPGGPVHTRVSAVLSTERLGPWSLGQRRARLIVNPWARRPLAGSPLAIDVREVRDERLHCTAGSSIAELLELPEGWPE
jgi:hypothetical protein